MKTCQCCGSPLGRSPGKDGDGLVPGVTFCPSCGAMYRWEHWRLSRWAGDTGSIYEPRLEKCGKEATR
jgi:hypothetical protein